MTRDVSAHPDVDVIEVNISCPTRDPGGGNFALHEDHTYKVDQAHPRGDRQAGLGEALAQCRRHRRHRAGRGKRRRRRADRRRTRILGLKINIDTFRPAIGNKFGGISGPGIKPIIVRMVHQVLAGREDPGHRLRRHLQGRGRRRIHARGRVRGDDRLPHLPQSVGLIAIIDELEKWCEKRGFARVADLTGAMINDPIADTFAAASAPIGQGHKTFVPTGSARVDASKRADDRPHHHPQARRLASARARRRDAQGRRSPSPRAISAARS